MKELRDSALTPINGAKKATVAFKTIPKCLFCGKALTGKQKKYCSRTHKDTYYNRKKKEKKETMQKRKSEAHQKTLENYRIFIENNLAVFQDLYENMNVLIRYGKRNKPVPMSFNLIVEHTKYYDEYSFPNDFKKLLKADFIKLYPEMEKCLK